MEISASHLGIWFLGLIKLGLLAIIPLCIVLYFTGHLTRILLYIYGDFTRNERNKFISYGVLFFFIIGIYWLLRSLKDPTFNAFIGSISPIRSSAVKSGLPCILVKRFSPLIFFSH